MRPSAGIFRIDVLETGRQGHTRAVLRTGDRVDDWRADGLEKTVDAAVTRMLESFPPPS